MSGYYHNHDRDKKAIDDYFVGKKFKYVRYPDEDERLAQDGVVCFVHVEVLDRARILDRAKMTPSAHFVFMSTAPSTLDGISVSKNIHVCPFPADRLREYEQMEAFFQSVSAGEPRWQLLRRRDTPQSLVAGYVALVAKRHGSLVDPSTTGDLSQLWNETKKTLDSMGIAAPKSWSDFAAMNEDALDAAIDQVKACLKKFAI